MASRRLYFDALKVGDEIPALAKAPVDRIQLVRYAGASGDFNPVHVDETFAKGLGMPSVYAPGMLIMGFLGQLVSDWARGAQLRRYTVKFNRMVWPGDTVVCKGRVTDRWSENGRYFSEIDLWAENQKGELVLKGQVQIQLFYSVDDEHRQRAGQPPIVVNVARQSILIAPPPVIETEIQLKKPATPVAKPKDKPVQKRPVGSGAKKLAKRVAPAAKKAAEKPKKKTKK